MTGKPGVGDATSPASPAPAAPEADPPSSLGRTMRRGAVISAGMLVVVQLVAFAQTLVLARILSPAEVGVFAAGTVLSSFLVTFSEGGMRNALVQRRDRLEDAANTAFWSTLIAGIGWALFAAAVAPLIGLFFDSELAAAVAFATAGSIVLHALTNVPEALLQRRFDFRQRLIVQPVVAVSYAVTSVVLALRGMGVWSLVVATYVSHVCWVVSTWVIARWRPGKGTPSRALWRELARFSAPMIIGTGLDRAQDMFQSAIVGRFLDTAALGNYRYGRRLAALPGTAIIEVGSYVLFPAFSRIAGDPVRFRTAFLRALTLLWVASIPLAGLLLAVGVPLAVLLLGEPWRGAGVIFAATAFVGPGTALSAVGMESIKGSGKTHLINRVTAVGIGSGVVLFLALANFGLVGIGIALSTATFAAGLTSVLLARREAGVSVREIVRRMYPALIAAAVAAVPVVVLEHLMLHSDQLHLGVGLAVIVSEALVYLSIYGGVLYLIARPLVKEMIGAIRAR
ncbi:lipopolysaccharide biosynthesis protein [Pseudonocardia sp. N23]|uniref:lipopolysaccharide biosynthesis protein n=1 Tax=Pseudonocardia sp. N23 TaxID=1987376 RepID=UPI000BFE231B|nr:lipopolysaccharide biosynthesis protein [Pseudonocardia sp. N23]